MTNSLPDLPSTEKRDKTEARPTKTHCKRGHPLEGPGARVRYRITKKGHNQRQCVPCHAIRAKEERKRWKRDEGSPR
jgi:hypothetical protein